MLLVRLALKSLWLAGFCIVFPIFFQTKSPYLIGQNVWLDPTDAIWNKVAACGVGSIRIGGIGYDDNMPDRPTLMNWVKRIKAMGAEPILQVPHTWSTDQALSLVKYFVSVLAHPLFSIINLG